MLILCSLSLVFIDRRPVNGPGSKTGRRNPYSTSALRALWLKTFAYTYVIEPFLGLSFDKQSRKPIIQNPRPRRSNFSDSPIPHIVLTLER